VRVLTSADCGPDLVVYFGLALNHKSNYKICMSMRFWSLLVGLLVIGSLMAADEQNGHSIKDLKALQGTWRLVAGEIGARKMTPEELKESKLVFKGHRYTVRRGNGPTVAGSFVIDSAKDPKTINITDSNGPYKGKTLLGIYALNDDELKECFAPPGEARPMKFATKIGTRRFLHVWKHVKD
jgi:uncharacterized protein (TIGR03067 family)